MNDNNKKKSFLDSNEEVKKEHEKVENEVAEMNNESKNSLDATVEKPKFDETKSAYENTREALKMFATGKASADEDYINELAGSIQQQIKDDVTADRKIGKTKKSTESIESQNKKAEQFYNSYKPVFEFTGLNSACGITLMKIILFVMLIPFLMIKLISGFFKLVSEFFDGLNGIFDSVTSFNKPLKNLLAVVFYGVLTIATVLIFIGGIEYFFDISILPH